MMNKENNSNKYNNSSFHASVEQEKTLRKSLKE